MQGIFHIFSLLASIQRVNMLGRKEVTLHVSIKIVDLIENNHVNYLNDFRRPIPNGNQSKFNP